jgi:tripartite-type tricarboxylate transporter receptor subunit TctC
MKIPRRAFLRFAGAAALTSVAGPRVLAQAYPTHPVRFVVGFPPGGAADLVARILGNWLAERLGQPVIIDNRPGASTNIAVQAVVNAPADGHTLLLAVATNAINASLFAALPFDFLRDIAPVSAFAQLQLVMEANPAVPARNVAELIALAKARPGKINAASFGTGTISHLAIELFKVTAGVNLVHVPYRGGAAMVTDLLGGQVDLAVDALPNSLPHIRQGTIRALALADAKRSAAIPELPTVGETLTGYEVNTWTGIGVPRGTPPEIIARLNRETNAALADPSVLARLADVGAAPILTTPTEFGAMIAADTDKWAKLVKRAGIRAE